MKLQNFAVVFIVIILPIAFILSIYTGNLIDVANKQAEYDSILLNSTYDAVRAYQLNTLKNTYESATNSKIRDINSSVNSFFNSLATGLSSSGYGKNELTDYIPAMIYTLYDGYYVYGSYDNIVNTKGEITYSRELNGKNRQYGIKPYIYYSCEYEKNGEYDIIVNYTLDNYITVTGTYKGKNGGMEYITQSGYYINFNNINIIKGESGPANFSNKTVILNKDKENQVIIEPEKLGEYITTYDRFITKQNNSTKYNYKLSNQSAQPKYYNYILYNNIKYYLDTDHIGTEVNKDEDGNNYSFNMTYDGYPIFFLDGNERTYISRNAFDEIKSYLGIEKDEAMYRVGPVSVDDKECFRDVNAYYYYYKSTMFSQNVYQILGQIDLGTAQVIDENGNSVSVIASNIPYDENGQLNPNNVIKTETYHTNYTTTNGVESHTKSTYDNPRVFELDDKGENNPELISSSFNRHRIDVIISSIESSLVSTIGSFNDYIGSTFDYSMPVLTEEEWDRICNNITIVSFMQGMAIGNYKYYSSYAIVANTKVKDFISKDSIMVQSANLNDDDKEYHNPRCEHYNEEKNKDEKEISIVGYKNIDYERQNCIVPAEEGRGGEEYFYYLQQGQAGYECVVNPNDNTFTTDELLNGIVKARENKQNLKLNPEIRRAYITALAREKGNSYKTYAFLNEELQTKNTLSQGEAAFTVHYLYQNYNFDTNTPVNKSYTEFSEKQYASTTLVGTLITSKNLNINTTPDTGYKYLGDSDMKIYDYQLDQYKTLNSSNNVLKNYAITDLALYFDIDDNQTKTIFYDTEYYLWNKENAKYDYKETKRTEEKKWINSDNSISVNLPTRYNNASLVSTDPDGYINPGNKVATGTIIKAYYSAQPNYYKKTYTVRYHSNNANGQMENSTFRFYENNILSPVKYTKEGYMFEGWALNPDSEVLYNDASTIAQADISNMTTENGQYYLDLYAKWVGSVYQVNYQSNGATSGVMKNSSHEFDIPSKLSKNEYKREFNVTLNVGPGQTNFYTKSFDKWGNSGTMTFDEQTKEYQIVFNEKTPKYSGLYYTGTNAILKPGKTATISYDVYSDQDTTIALKIQNSIVGEGYSKERKDGSNKIEPELISIKKGEWTTIYFSYTNNSDKNIYDYSILSLEDNTEKTTLRIKNPKFEIINAKTIKKDSATETATISSEFLYWKYNEKNYQDEENILNLTDKNGEIINMTAQWKDSSLYLPEIYSPGYKFLGWVDEDGEKINPNNPIEIKKDKTFNALWEDHILPNVNIKVINTTTNTITTQTTATDEGSGLRPLLNYTYFIKEKGAPERNWQEFNGYSMSEYTFKNLKQNTSYDIKVIVEGDNAGNSGTSTTIGTTRQLTGEIFVKSQKWYQNINNEGTQTIKFGIEKITTDNLYIEYRMESESEWTKGDTAYDIKHGQTVYARITDGINHLASISARAWDNIKPNIELINSTAAEDLPNNILITAYVTENETGLGSNPTYTFSYKKTNESNYKEIKTKNNKYNFTGLEQNTNYDIKVSVSDLAGNVGEKTIRIKTTYKYKIIFNSNGATNGSMEPLICTKDVSVRLPKNKFEKTGYVWAYWKNDNGTYFDMQYVINLSKAGEDVTLDAVWETYKKYIVKDGEPQVVWERASVEQNSNVTVELSNGPKEGYGLKRVKSNNEQNYGTGIIDAAGLVTSQKVDFTGFNKIVFEFAKWARDDTESGYYGTCAGIYSNKTVGVGDNQYLATRPKSMIAGWVCNEIKSTWVRNESGLDIHNSRIETLDIPQNTKSAYIGLSSGAGFYGDGYICVLNIYLTSE